MNEAPIRSPLEVMDARNAPSQWVARWPRPWANWFQRLTNAIGWNFALTATLTHDFGSVAAGAEASTTVTVTGAATTNNPAVVVTSSANTAGIVYSALVTAADTVTIYAKNFTTGSIDPASATFRVVVLQL